MWIVLALAFAVCLIAILAYWWFLHRAGWRGRGRWGTRASPVRMLAALGAVGVAVVVLALIR
jgi:hypothetical protein